MYMLFFMSIHAPTDDQVLLKIFIDERRIFNVNQNCIGLSLVHPSWAHKHNSLYYFMPFILQHSKNYESFEVIARESNLLDVFCSLKIQITHLM